ncbi:MAG: hypothetical protein LC104_19440 [Bacteroidales bacterium]|nr:hypothetical protein [Bacteroidales bacterium]
MTLPNAIFDSGIPSSNIDLLQRVVGSDIRSLIRYSWLPPEEAVIEWNIVPQELLFSFAAGPILIGLDDGAVIGVASDPSIISVIMWLECDREGRERIPRLADDRELYPISATNEQWASPAIHELLGKKIESIRIFQRHPELEKWKAYPCEVGLQIECVGGGKLLLSHGLHDDSDDFSVITPGQVSPLLVSRLSELQVIQ